MWFTPLIVIEETVTPLVGNPDTDIAAGYGEAVVRSLIVTEEAFVNVCVVKVVAVATIGTSVPAQVVIVAGLTVTVAPNGLTVTA